MCFSRTDTHEKAFSILLPRIFETVPTENVPVDRPTLCAKEMNTKGVHICRIVEIRQSCDEKTKRGLGDNEGILIALSCYCSNVHNFRTDIDTPECTHPNSWMYMEKIVTLGECGERSNGLDHSSHFQTLTATTPDTKSRNAITWRGSAAGKTILTNINDMKDTWTALCLSYTYQPLRHVFFEFQLMYIPGGTVSV